jgi:RimJ/RimL family protein N-acetyltransferase
MSSKIDFNMNFPIDYQSFLIRPEKIEDVQHIKSFSDALIQERALIGRKESRSFEEWSNSIQNTISSVKNNQSVALAVEKQFKDGSYEIVAIGAIFMKQQKMDHFGDLGIMLAKSVRRIGLGSKLMEILISWGKKHLKNLKCIELGVAAENMDAIKLYKKMGFKRVATLPSKINHFGTYFDEDIMHLWVD